MAIDLAIEWLQERGHKVPTDVLKLAYKHRLKKILASDGPDDNKRRKHEKEWTVVIKKYFDTLYKRIINIAQEDGRVDQQFWENEKKELWASMLSVFMDVTMDGVSGGIYNLPSDIQTLTQFDVINQGVLDYIRQYQYGWIVGINETTRKQVQQIFEDWLQSGQPLQSLKEQLRPIFGEMRAEMIAVTEVTRIYAMTNILTWNSTGFVSSKKWMTSYDDRVCPICAPLNGMEVLLGNSFPSDIGGGFEAPPAHPRCRCWLLPVVDIDKVLSLTQGILYE